MSHAGSTSIPVGRETLDASLDVPELARAVVVFAHGAGSSRLSPRNVRVAQLLRSTGEFGTLLFDLLTSEEDRRYEHRFDIDLLTERLAVATRWAGRPPGGVWVRRKRVSSSYRCRVVLTPSLMLWERLG